jgi:hypothetical protein
MERMHGSKRYRVILGKLKGWGGPDDPMVEQTYRYPADVWTAEQALSHGRAHGGTLFEPATE